MGVAATGLTWKDFLLMIGRVLLYTIPLYLITKKFPAFRNTEWSSLMFDAVFLAALYPAARKSGFSPSKWRGYLAGVKSELLPAFKWFLVTMSVVWLAVQAFSLALAPWDMHWTNLLLFWLDSTSNPTSSEARLVGLIANPLLIPVDVLSVCVLAPIMEEFLYRRWLYTAIRGFMPVAAAIVLNGALFGAMHGADFFSTGLCGVFFCWSYQRSGRLATPILLHAFVNLFATGAWFYTYFAR